MTAPHPSDPETDRWHHEIQSPVGALVIVAGLQPGPGIRAATNTDNGTGTGTVAIVGLYHAGHSPAPAPAHLGLRILTDDVREWDAPTTTSDSAVAPPAPVVDLLLRADQELAEYFAGSRRTFDLPLALHGTEFQQQVWAEVGAIPYGGTRSYRDIAVRLGNPRMGRAIGAAVRSNPVSIIVPGHRVVSSTGAVIGYAAGTGAKTALLELEADHRDDPGPGAPG
ncbi:cysteine methyltransferase [Arthrobacter pityocampae]|uniref:methylated-DNA--[protein]-cysteine S-methyltransferase n=1 Tax=Arthrobacter pityocampae TaxID=547334 RepID=A0A2S5J105_9MICC|nr:methylated-DNA--[protein]-cysteine S-methyltransferase [Arthrobacter pityocampae]PPB50512.1 cysteine methyltransferase [Arthrobacter pityocampae]